IKRAAPAAITLPLAGTLPFPDGPHLRTWRIVGGGAASAVPSAAGRARPGGRILRTRGRGGRAPRRFGRGRRLPDRGGGEGRSQPARGRGVRDRRGNARGTRGAARGGTRRPPRGG